MKKLLVLLIALGACSTNDPDPIVGTFSFKTDKFEGSFSVNNDGTGTGTFTIEGREYTALNTDLRRGSSIIMYSEDGAYLGIHKIDMPISSYQEYRQGGLPSPFRKQERSENLVLTP